MNKKILISLSLIAAVAAIVVGATTAWFSDTETSSGNTFTAGTIDISVDEQNPWTAENTFTIEDMKPCEVEYRTVKITNVGTNPADIWKHLELDGCSGGLTGYTCHGVDVSSEPECEEGTVGGVYTEKCDIDTVIIYDLYVCKLTGNNTCEVNNDGSPKDGTGWTALIEEDENVMLSNVDCCWNYLDRLDKDETMYVLQSYHMKGDTTNWAQGDSIDLTVELYAQQIDEDTGNKLPAPGTECSL